MDAQSPQSLMYQVLSVRENVNLLTKKMGTIDSEFFQPLSLPIPRFRPAELGFIRTVSWLYVLYHEAGNINVEYIVELFPAYKGSINQEIASHIVLVQRLRTYLQHNLDDVKPQNLKIQQHCEDWLKRECGTPLPESEEHWEKCLLSILVEATVFLDMIQRCIRLIESDESRDGMLNVWSFRQRRHHEPHEFDSIIAVVVTDMGRDGIDFVKFRKRYYDAWHKQLEFLKGDYDFSVEARKLIEYTLLTEMKPVLPITGQDIMTVFELPPGRRVGELLEKAKALYEAEPCTRDELLAKLKETMPAQEVKIS